MRHWRTHLTKGEGKLGEGEGEDIKCRDQVLLILDKLILTKGKDLELLYTDYPN